MYSKCSEKLGFDTKSEAESAAVTADYQRDIKLDVYKCDKCNLWHLTTNWGDNNDNK